MNGLYKQNTRFWQFKVRLSMEFIWTDTVWRIHSRYISTHRLLRNKFLFGITL